MQTNRLDAFSMSRHAEHPTRLTFGELCRVVGWAVVVALALPLGLATAGFVRHGGGLTDWLMIWLLNAGILGVVLVPAATVAAGSLSRRPAMADDLLILIRVAPLDVLAAAGLLGAAGLSLSGASLYAAQGIIPLALMCLMFARGLEIALLPPLRLAMWRCRPWVCGGCGYDRTGLPAAAACPECGSPAAVEEPAVGTPRALGRGRAPGLGLEWSSVGSGVGLCLIALIYGFKASAGTDPDDAELRSLAVFAIVLLGVSTLMGVVVRRILRSATQREERA